MQISFSKTTEIINGKRKTSFKTDGLLPLILCFVAILSLPTTINNGIFTEKLSPDQYQIWRFEEDRRNNSDGVGSYEVYYVYFDYDVDGKHYTVRKKVHSTVYAKVEKAYSDWINGSSDLTPSEVLGPIKYSWLNPEVIKIK